jgi:hypothetical protein
MRMFVDNWKDGKENAAEETVHNLNVTTVCLFACVCKCAQCACMHMLHSFVFTYSRKKLQATEVCAKRWAQR